MNKVTIYKDSQGKEFGRVYSMKPKTCPNGHILYVIGKDEKCCGENCKYGVTDDK